MKDLKEKDILVHIGKRVRLLREQILNMDQEEFAEFMDCSKDTISKIERGEQSMKNWRLIRLCDACNVSTDYLLRGIDVSDIDDVPYHVIEMYKNADPEELGILQDYMKHAKEEIRRSRMWKEYIKKMQNHFGLLPD